MSKNSTQLSSSSSSSPSPSPSPSPHGKKKTRGRDRFTDDQVEFLRQTFVLFDKQSQNAVKMRDLPTVIRVTTGIRLSQEQIVQQMQQLCPELLEKYTMSSSSFSSITAANGGSSGGDGGGGGDGQKQSVAGQQHVKPSTLADMMVPFETYLDILASRMLPDDPQEREAFLRREEFNFIDVNRSGNISSGELRHVFKQIGENLSEEEVRRMIDDVDVNKDNSISFEEFVKMDFIRKK